MAVGELPEERSKKECLVRVGFFFDGQADVKRMCVAGMISECGESLAKSSGTRKQINNRNGGLASVLTHGGRIAAAICTGKDRGSQ